MTLTPVILIQRIRDILMDQPAAFLCTLEKSGYPRGRWMCPTLVPGNDECLYAISSPFFAKIKEISHHPKVSWTLQSKQFDQVIQLWGTIQVRDIPALRSQVIELVGKELRHFWTLANTQEDTKFIVLETLIEEATLYEPLVGRRESVTFSSSHKGASALQ